MDNTASDILSFQLERATISLYKQFLITLEDVRDEHKEMLDKLRDKLPVEYHSLLDASDYFTDTKFTKLRKRVLDSGNGTVRANKEQFTQFDVEFKQGNTQQG